MTFGVMIIQEAEAPLYTYVNMIKVQLKYKEKKKYGSLTGNGEVVVTFVSNSVIFKTSVQCGVLGCNV